MPKPTPMLVTVDVVALSVHPDDGLCALVIRRGAEPHHGRWALPGGFVEPDEALDKAATRELAEETGISPRKVRLHQVGAYGAPRRDPRGRVLSVAWLAALPASTVLAAGDDAAEAQWRPVAGLLRSRRLAFDHATILRDAVATAAALLEDTAFGLRFLGKAFTVSDLREVYEAVWDEELDPGNFQRKVTGVPGLLEPLGESVQRGRGRPAALYTHGDTQVIAPPLVRSV